MPWLVDPEVRDRVKQVGVPFNRHGVDRFGTSEVDVARMLTVFRWFYRSYFDVTTHGVEHIPPHGRVMLVGNHSGGWAIDAMMVIASVFLEMEPPRLAQGMADKFLNRLPFASLLTVRSGQLTGLPETAVQLLENDRLLLVFPEGSRGTEKLYGDRNTLVRFGSGFIRLALQTGTPIVPFAFLGGGDAVPSVLNLYRIGRLVGVPYIPVTPYLLPIPRRVPLQVYYSEPMRFEGTGAENDDVINGYVDQVRRRIAGLIERGESARRDPGERSAISAQLSARPGG